MRKITLVIFMLVITILAAACDRGGTQQAAPTAPPTQGAPNMNTPADPSRPAPPPTMVADGKTPEDHVKAYFDAYKEGRYEDAYELQPSANKVKQPKDQYVPLRKSMPITEYKVNPSQEQGGQTLIAVEYDLGAQGKWISTWTFQKKGDKWEALEYRANMGQ